MRPASAPIWTISRGSSTPGGDAEDGVRPAVKDEECAGRRLPAERQLGESAGHVRGEAADRLERECGGRQRGDGRRHDAELNEHLLQLVAH